MSVTHNDELTNHATIEIYSSTISFKATVSYNHEAWDYTLSVLSKGASANHGLADQLLEPIVNKLMKKAEERDKK